MLSETCQEFHIQALDGRRWMNGLAALGSGASLTSGLFKARGLDRWIDKVCRETEFDAVLVYCSSMASYARRPGLANVPRIVDLVDVDSEKWRQYAAASGPFLRRLYDREFRLLRREEITLGRESEAILLTTLAEASLYRSFAPSVDPTVMGNGVDHAYFAEPVTGPVQSSDLVFVGALDYRPNIDGVLWFHREVWPALRAKHPELTWNIVGRRPGAEIQRLHGLAGINVFANVPDVRPYLQQSKIAVVPLQVARGVQNKVLEAMAAGVAVTISPDVAKGIPVRHRFDAAIAENPSAWIEELERLLNDSDVRSRLAKSGQQFVRTSYSWDEQLRVLDQLLDTLSGDKRPVISPNFTAPEPLVLK